jgi:hypothetical protein
MLKFLRKYNKWILAVGGTLLMITFLIPFAITDMGAMAAQGSAAWATIGPDNDKVTRNDLRKAQDELAVAETWLRYVFQTSYQNIQLPAEAYQAFGDLAQLNVERPDHWYLLALEAEQAGMIGGPGEAVHLLGRDADAAVLAIAMNSAMQSHRGDTHFVRMTLAKIRGISRMIGLYRTAAIHSDARMISRLREMYESAEADVVVIQASNKAAGAQPSEDRIAAHMAAYADKLPGEGDRGFGYKLPNRVKIEWLAVSGDSIRRMLERSDKMSNVELRKHWTQRAKVDLTVGAPSGTAPIPEAVRKDLLDKLAAEATEDITKFAADQLRLDRRSLAQEHGYLVIPPGWKGMSFEDLARRVQEQFKIDLPAVVSMGDRWLGASDLDELEGVGAATTDKLGRTPLRLSELAMNAREFEGHPDRPIQVGIAGPPLRGSDGSIFVFRLTDADPSRPPRSVDEVRDKVVADLIRLDNFEALKARMPEIRQQALDSGLLTLAMANDTAVERMPYLMLNDPIESYRARQRGEGLRARPTPLPIVGPEEDLVRQIVAVTRAIPVSTRVSDVPLEQRTLVLPAENDLSVVVVQINGRRPLTREALASLLDQPDIGPTLLVEEVSDPASFLDAFKSEALTARHQFRILGGSREDDADDAAVPARAGMGG